MTAYFLPGARGVFFALLLILSNAFGSHARELGVATQHTQLHYPSSIEHRNSPERTGELSFLPSRIWDDVHLLINDPTFLAIAGGIVATPLFMRGMQVGESPELTRLWAPSPGADRFFEAGEWLGEGYVPVSIAATALAWGHLSSRPKSANFGRDLIRAQIATGLVTTIMKRSIDRQRPDGAPHAYPSGHTSSAFATAAVLSRHAGPIWSGVAFGAASYVGLSRLQENKHYLTDVLAGAVLGSLIGLKLSDKQGGHRFVVIAPQSTGAGMGIGVHLRL